MNLTAYVDGLTRSASNLPRVLHEWADFDEDLQSHYAHALTEQFVMIGAARSFAVTREDQLRLQHGWEELVAVVARYAVEIEAVMALNVSQLCGISM